MHTCPDQQVVNLLEMKNQGTKVFTVRILFRPLVLCTTPPTAVRLEAKDPEPTGPTGGTGDGHRRSGHGRVQPVAPDRAVRAQQPHEPARLDAEARAQQQGPDQRRERRRRQEAGVSDPSQKQQVRRGTESTGKWASEQ